MWYIVVFVFIEYFEYFGPDFTLHPDVSTKMENQNTRQVNIIVMLLTISATLSIWIRSSNMF